MSYPSGRALTYTFDSTAGRVQSVANYASGIGYWANGAVRQMTLGNNLVEQTCLNSRFQATGIRLGGSGTYNCGNSGSDALNLGYTYAASSNNGNPSNQTIQRPGGSWTQSYYYDGVNRLQSAYESGTGGWALSFGYDALGNRWLASGSGLPGLTAETPTGPSWYSSNNRIVNWGYDGAGNVTQVASMNRSFTYDGENRQITAVVNSQSQTYVYDGDGRRVRKVTPVGATTFIYDASGQLAAEYSTGAGTDSGVSYLTADHLGSTRLITDAGGGVKRSFDYTPFGEEVLAGYAGRTVGMVSTTAAR